MSRVENSSPSPGRIDLEAILSLVFQGSEQTIRQHLKALPAEARAEAFAKSSTRLATLRRCCRLYDEGQTVPLAALEEAARESAKNLKDLRVEDGRFFVRLQMVWVGLAGRQKIAQGLKRSDHVDWHRPMVRPVAEVLLDRPEDWVKEAFLDWLAHLDRWTAGTQGALELLRDLVAELPTWRPDLEPFFSKRAAFEGFDPRILRSLPTYLLIAGLQDDDVAVLTDWQIYPRVVSHLNAGKIPRKPLLETTLDKLQTPMRQGLERAWLDLLAVIDPTEAERDEQAERYEALLTASSGAPARLGLAETERRLASWVGDEDWASRILGLATIGLEHRVQSTATRAFRLVKRILKAQPTLSPQAIESIIGALASPHAALGKAVLSWLERANPALFSAQDLNLLAELATDLNIEQRETIRHLLPKESEQEPAAEEVATPALDLKSLLARATGRASGPDSPLAPIDHRRAEWLEYFVQNGALPRQARGLPQEPIALVPFASAEEMLALLSQPGEDDFSATEKELLFDGVARFPTDADEKERLRRLFDPVIQRLEKADFFVKARDRFIALILHAWADADLPKIISTEDLDAQAALHLASLDKASTAREDPRPETLYAPTLSTMTHVGGWLDSLVFAERWSNAPQVSALDLERAFYRLSGDEDSRQHAWDRVRERADDLLILALGPEIEAKAALDRLTTNLPSPGPSPGAAFDDMLDLLVDAMPMDGESPSGEKHQALAAALEEKSSFLRDVEEKGLKLRLIMAALRGRLGLADARPLCSERVLERLRGQIEIKMTYRSDHLEEVNDYLFHRLLDPHPVDPSHFPEDLILVDTFDLGIWLALSPYLMAVLPRYVGARGVKRVSSLYPPIAQRLFEAGLARLDQAMEYKSSRASGGEASLLLLEAAEAGHVEVAERLEEFIVLLSCRFPQNRERAIDLAIVWLNDGRISPREFAAGLGSLITGAAKGAKYVDEALESLSVSGEAMARAVQLSLESLVVESWQDLAPRVRTLMLDRLSTLLDSFEEGIRDPAARRHLEDLAAAKRSSALRDRARRLIRRPAGSDLPIEVECHAALLDLALESTGAAPEGQ